MRSRARSILAVSLGLHAHGYSSSVPSTLRHHVEGVLGSWLHAVQPGMQLRDTPLGMHLRVMLSTS